MANDEKRGWWQWLLSVPPIAVLALLSILYLASAGPLHGLHDRGLLSDSQLETICRTVYFPLYYLARETEFFDTPVGEAYMWYIELFID